MKPRVLDGDSLLDLGLERLDALGRFGLDGLDVVADAIQFVGVNVRVNHLLCLVTPISRRLLNAASERPVAVRFERRLDDAPQQVRTKRRQGVDFGLLVAERPTPWSSPWVAGFQRRRR